jgi:amino-acid N-acetyltransferase
MKIRKANGLDGAAIKKLIRAYPEKLVQAHLPRTGEFFVAIEDKKIIGCCALAVYSKRLAEIRSLAVSKDHQGKGIGGALVDACLKEAKRRKVYEVLSVTGAKELFEKHGFNTFNREKYAMIRVLG